MWGCRLAWSRLVDLGSIDSGSNPGSPTILVRGAGFSLVQWKKCGVVVISSILLVKWVSGVFCQYRLYFVYPRGKSV